MSDDDDGDGDNRPKDSIFGMIDDISSLTLWASATETSRENIMHRSSNLNLVILSDDDSGL